MTYLKTWVEIRETWLCATAGVQVVSKHILSLNAALATSWNLHHLCMFVQLFSWSVTWVHEQPGGIPPKTWCKHDAISSEQKDIALSGQVNSTVFLTLASLLSNPRHQSANWRRVAEWVDSSTGSLLEIVLSLDLCPGNCSVGFWHKLILWQTADFSIGDLLLLLWVSDHQFLDSMVWPCCDLCRMPDL